MQVTEKKVEYYEVLGIEKKATHDEVKQAYKKLAMVNIVLISETSS